METTTEKLTKKQKEELAIALIMIDSFTWSKTSSGGKYWNEVCLKLMDLSNQKEERKVCDKCGHELEGKE